MLTPRENFLETIHGGKPERFVNQYEYFKLLIDPITMSVAGMCPKGGSAMTALGVTVAWPEGTPGPFPVHTPDKIVLKDITQWREVVKLPDPRSYPQEAWAPFEEMAKTIDRKETFAACFVAPGLFEKLHYLMSIEEALVALLEEPEECKALVDYLADWEIECAKVQIEHLHPDALFHHDDWGSQRSSFMSPSTFEEIFLPAYKRVYGFWKENGVEVIIHHSDSYAANLVPHMIEMGIDVFQGAVVDNDIPKLLKEYGGKISIHGGMDNTKYDLPDWTPEKIEKGLEELVASCGKDYLIPGFIRGGEGSIFPGAYDCLTNAIDKLSEKYFPGFKADSIKREPVKDMFA